MSTLRSEAGSLRDEVDAFLDLLLGDDDLLDAEFDAIIRASWKGRPPASRPASCGPDGHAQRLDGLPAPAPSRSGERGRDGDGCQRAPPGW